MPYTTKDLEQIEAAILKLQSGERVVQVAHDGHVVKYAEVQLSELIALRNEVKGQLHLANKKKIRHMQVITHKGTH